MKFLLIKVALCLAVFGVCFYRSIDKQNTLTRMRMQIPRLSKELKSFQEENLKLQYEIDAFASPQHLLELARQDGYAHLKHPYANQVMALAAGPAVKVPEPETTSTTINPRLPLATGAHR